MVVRIAALVIAGLLLHFFAASTANVATGSTGIEVAYAAAADNAATASAVSAFRIDVTGPNSEPCQQSGGSVACDSCCHGMVADVSVVPANALALSRVKVVPPDARRFVAVTLLPPVPPPQA